MLYVKQAKKYVYCMTPFIKILDLKKSTIVTERISVCLGNAESQTIRGGAKMAELQMW